MTPATSTSHAAHDELLQLARQLGALRRGRRILGALAVVFTLYLGWVLVESARPLNAATTATTTTPSETNR